MKVVFSIFRDNLLVVHVKLHSGSSQVRGACANTTFKHDNPKYPEFHYKASKPLLSFNYVKRFLTLSDPIAELGCKSAEHFNSATKPFLQMDEGPALISKYGSYESSFKKYRNLALS
jgi:hypothetical protein